MKLFKLETPDLWLPDEVNLIFVRAESERAARWIARNYANDRRGRYHNDGRNEYVEAWTNPRAATCEEIAVEGDAGVVHHVCGYN